MMKTKTIFHSNEIVSLIILKAFIGEYSPVVKKLAQDMGRYVIIDRKCSDICLFDRFSSISIDGNSILAYYQVCLTGVLTPYSGDFLIKSPSPDYDYLYRNDINMST